MSLDYNLGPELGLKPCLYLFLFSPERSLKLLSILLAMQTSFAAYQCLYYTWLNMYYKDQSGVKMWKTG